MSMRNMTIAPTGEVDEVDEDGEAEDVEFVFTLITLSTPRAAALQVIVKASWMTRIKRAAKYRLEFFLIRSHAAAT